MDMVCVSSSSDRPAMKAHEYRKIVKPLLERRRRARINQCLTDLKGLLLENNPNIDNNEASKLEKADILELTVRHLRDLRRHHRSFSAASAAPMPSSVSPTSNEEFRAGFRECAHEVASCIATLPGMDSGLRSRLIAHLTGRVPNTPLTPTSPMTPSANPTPPPSPSCSTASSHADYLPLSPAASPLDLSPYPTFVYHQREMQQHSEQQQPMHPPEMIMYHHHQQQPSASPVHHQLAAPADMAASPRRELKAVSSPWRPW